MASVVEVTAYLVAIVHSVECISIIVNSLSSKLQGVINYLDTLPSLSVDQQDLQNLLIIVLALR